MFFKEKHKTIVNEKIYKYLLHRRPYTGNAAPGDPRTAFANSGY